MAAGGHPSSLLHAWQLWSPLYLKPFSCCSSMFSWIQYCGTATQAVVQLLLFDTAPCHCLWCLYMFMSLEPKGLEAAQDSWKGVHVYGKL